MSNFELSSSAYSTIQETQLKYWEKIRHPFVAGLELTPYCNLRCIHCYMQKYPSLKMLSTNQWKAIIDKLYEDGVLILYMTGGEIFTRNDFVEIYAYAKKRGFIIELLTNATGLNKSIIQVLKQYPPATISISIYGMNEETYDKVTRIKGSFVRFITAVEQLKSADIDMELKFIGLKENVNDFEDAMHFAEEIGAKFKFNFEIFPTLNGDNSILSHKLENKKILEIEKKTPSVAKVWAANVNRGNPFINNERVPLYTCNVASTLCYIDCEGYVSPCNKMRLKKHNILEESLKEIWKSYVNEYARKLAPPDYKCAKCKYMHICSPCPVVNELCTGDSSKPDLSNCEIAELRTKEFSKAKYNKYREIN